MGNKSKAMKKVTLLSSRIQKWEEETKRKKKIMSD